MKQKDVEIDNVKYTVYSVAVNFTNGLRLTI